MLIKTPKTAQEISREQRPCAVNSESILIHRIVTNISTLNGAVGTPPWDCRRPCRAPSTDLSRGRGLLAGY